MSGQQAVALLVTVVALAAAALVNRAPRVPARAGPATLVLVTAACWAALDALTVIPPQARAAWQAPFGATAGLGLLMFAVHRAGGRWRPRHTRLLLIEPAAVTLAAATSRWHPLLVTAGGGRGPLAWLHLMYLVGLMMAGTGLLLTTVLRTPPGYEQVLRSLVVVSYASPAAALLVASSSGAVVRSSALLGPVCAVVAIGVPLLITSRLDRQAPWRRITLDEVVEVLGEGLLVIDAAGRVIVANSEACRLLGDLAVGDLVGDRLAEVAPGFARVLQDGGGIVWVGRRFVDVRVGPVDANEPLRGTVVVTQDVTEAELGRMRLVEQAATDALTGLRNRHRLDEELAAAIEPAVRENRDVCAAMIDIDRFKVVNDTHGHAVGDRVLVEVARVIRAFAGRGDVLARYGGEEFLLLMVDADLAAAAARMDRLRRSCNATEVPSRDGGVHVTVSAGVAALQPGQDAADLVRAADRALYRAKEERDRVVADGA